MTFTVDDPDGRARSAARPSCATASRSAISPAAAGATRSGKNIGLGYVRNPDGVDDDFLRSGRYELEVATVRVPAALHMGPLYDPTNARVKA